MARGGAANLAGSVVNGLSGLALTLVLTRLLGQVEAGTFLALSSVFLIVLAVVELGATTGLARWVATHRAEGRNQDLRATLRAALVPVALVAAAGAALLWPWAGSLSALVGAGTATSAGGPAAVVALRLLLLLLPFAAVYDLLLAATRGFRSFRPTVLVERVGRVGAQFLLVWAAVTAGTGVLGAALAWGLPYLPALVVVAAATRRLLVAAERGGRAPVAPALVGPAPAGPDRADLRPASVAREFWSYTWLRGISRIFQVCLQRLDIVLVAAMLGPAQAAVYTAATRLVPVGLLGVQAVQEVLQPALATLLARRDTEQAQQVYAASTAWSIALSWPVYLAAAVFAVPVLKVFGAGYQSGAASMVVISAAMLVATACGAADMALLMSGRSGLSLANTGAGLALNVALNLLLLPRLGILGAALAWAVAILATNLPPLVQVRARLGLVPFSRAGALTAAACLVCFGLGAGAGRLVLGADAGPAAVLAALLPPAALYAAALWRLRRTLGLHLLLAGRRRRPAPAATG